MTLVHGVELQFQILRKGARPSLVEAKGGLLLVLVELMAVFVPQLVVVHPLEEVPPYRVPVVALPHAAPEYEIPVKKAVAQMTLFLLKAPSVHPHPQAS